MNTAAVTWKIANIITLSHYISVEMLCTKSQLSFSGVCYHKGLIHHSAVILVLGGCGHCH